MLYWKKSSHSEGNGACVEIGWFVSSYTANNGACVECALLPDAMSIRDTKDRTGPILFADHATWTGFVAAIKADALP